ncbi:hypothetical protein [Thiococcus pfennigii]|nr:hypothetical protein [Thiococcus pfennigii]
MHPRPSYGDAPLVEQKRRRHRLRVEGMDVEVPRADGRIGGDEAVL